RTILLALSHLAGLARAAQHRARRRADRGLRPVPAREPRSAPHDELATARPGVRRRHGVVVLRCAGVARTARARGDRAAAAAWSRMSPGSWYAERFDATYLDAYAHRDEEEARRAVAGLFAPLGLAGRRVLDLACGAGRYSRALAAGGATVVGLDLSAPLLAAASRTVTADVAFVRGDMRCLPFRDATFEVVASMFTSFGYFEKAGEDRQVLAEVARVLQK